eukprot:scaffold538663_cov17-Prasinocladus_malaysianus.AAC.1
MDACYQHRAVMCASTATVATHGGMAGILHGTAIRPKQQNRNLQSKWPGERIRELQFVASATICIDRITRCRADIIIRGEAN